MGERRFPETELPDLEADFKPRATLGDKISGFSRTAFGVIKLILGIALLPFVYSVTAAFLNDFILIDKALQVYFWRGIIALLIIYLFIWEPAIVYVKGQKILELVFNFFKPLVRIAPYLLPIYTIILFVVYGLLSLVVRNEWLIRYSIFLTGFTLCLHLVFSAKTIRSKKSDFLKSNYIFGFSFAYILNIALLAFCLNLVFKEFSFVNFSNNAISAAQNIFYAVFKQLFLR